MTTPAVLEGQGFEYLDQSVADEAGVPVPVFVAHARKEDPEADRLEDRFKAELSRSLHLGRLPVRIGEGMPGSEVLTHSLAKDRARKVWMDASAEGYESFGLLGFGRVIREGRYDEQSELVRLFTGEGDSPELGGEAFAAAINEELERRGSSTVTIYVHGFNTRFIDNVCRSAELSHYLGRDGAMISFQWPSKARAASYFVDKAASRNVLRHFRELLIFLAEHTDAEEIDIIGHSAGTLVVVETLRHLSLIHANVSDDEVQKRLKIGEVVLAAPDIGREEAINAMMDGAGRVPSAVTIYFSQLDSALSLSRFLYGEERLGFAPRLVPVPIEIGDLNASRMTVTRRDVPRSLYKELTDGGLYVVDATSAQRGFSLSFFAHDYFAYNPYVSSDMLLFLKHGNGPDERLLELRHARRDRDEDSDESSWYFSFPDDLDKYREDVLKLAPGR